ncbi:hypothetical protein PsYK624_085720 [Phanerochaete sordida]|uniref:Uncharacterized protein n=1 Tax=Phanerochaete sordida TaxID=48140 RepID=A0A9P3GAG2_9APHY|nr:hypothetical protein PsYK624_085720 [Phanerochaete sordida]
MANLEAASRHPASRHSSISDLRLARLPEPAFAEAADDGSNRGTPRLHSDRPIRPWPGSDPSLPPPPQGPSQRSDAHALTSRVSLTHGSGDPSRAEDPALAPSGLGLALANSAPAPQQVSGQDDLQQVNRSLMQLVLEARASRRGSRPVSVASAADIAEFRSGSWEPPAPHADAAPGPDDRPRAHASPEAGAAGASGALASRDPRSVHRRDSEPVSSHAADYARHRRHSNVAVAPAPPIASSVSFHSERHVPPPSAASHPPRQPSAGHPQGFGGFGQQGGGGMLNASSLLLTMPPPGPTTSSATTANGDPSSIRAPRPVNGRATNIFALWNTRNTR